MDKECYLCKSKENDEVKFGEFMTRGKISVHYFCLLLSSNLMQNGTDEDGFLGFLRRDIQLEALRVKSLDCCYCKKPWANISCCATRCYKSFHLTCGDKNSTEHNFVGTFQSFCHRHIKGKKVTPPLPDEKCCICYDNIMGPNQKFDTVKMIRAPCCKNGWFHKYCLAAFARASGYFFKCPLCNDSKVFRQRLTYKGIFIPDRDAAWELEPNAFAELLERPNKCSAIDCHAEGGRESQTKRNELVICSTCGSAAIHRRCMTVQMKDFLCHECSSLTRAIQTSLVVNITASQNNIFFNAVDTDDEINVEDVFEVRTSTSSIRNKFEESDADETIKPNDLLLKRTVFEQSNSDSHNEEMLSFSNDVSDIDIGKEKKQEENIHLSDYMCNSKILLEKSISNYVDKLGDSKIVLQVKKSKNFEKDKRADRRSKSLNEVNDGFKSNVKRKRRFSATENAFSLDEQTFSPYSKIKNNDQSSSYKNKTKSSLQDNAPVKEVDKGFGCSSEKVFSMRLRSRSAELSKIDTVRVSQRRRSCIPCSGPKFSELPRSKRLNESLEPASNKRMRLDSITETPRHTVTKRNSNSNKNGDIKDCYEDENYYKKSYDIHDRFSRKRSPLVANITDIDAYLKHSIGKKSENLQRYSGKCFYNLGIKDVSQDDYNRGRTAK